MGTTMSSVGLANKPPALPPVKQNNKTVSGWFALKILFILPTKRSYCNLYLQYYYCNVMARQSSGLLNPQNLLRNQLCIHLARFYQLDYHQHKMHYDIFSSVQAFAADQLRLLLSVQVLVESCVFKMSVCRSCC